MNEVISSVTVDNHTVLGLMYAFGFISHYIQKCAKEKINYIEYWKTNPMYSGLSVIGAIGGFTGMLTSGVTDMYAYFMAGFMADSLFNKYQPTMPSISVPDSK